MESHEPDLQGDLVRPRAVKPVTSYLLVPATPLLMSTVNLYVGPLTRTQRADKVRRYLEKKKSRSYSKKIRYECRQKLAEKRKRVQGRFMKGNELPDDISMGCMDIDDFQDDISMEAPDIM